MNDDLAPLPSAKAGRYRHYKGGEYEVLGVVRHSETLEPLVLYRALYGEHGLWVRPHAMFFGTVEADGVTQPRFRAVASPDSAAEAFRSAVTPLLAELEASANAHDTDRHMAAYARDASLTFVFNGDVVRGWDALRDMQRQWWNDGQAKGTYAYQGSPVIEVLGEDAGITTFLIAARRKLGDGTVVEKTLAYSALWRRRPEGWRITFAHESSTR